METSFFASKSNRVLGSLVLVALFVALVTYACYTYKQSQYIHTGPVTISVMGESEVTAKPDIGQFNFSVVAQAADAGEAQELSGTKTEEIIAFLKKEGVEDKDIKNTYYGVNPKYRYEPRPCPSGSYCPPEQVQDGFEVNQTVSVKVRKVDNSGALIAGVGKLGATNISNLQFTIDDTDVLKESARAEAIKDAKAKAKVLADDLGVRIVKMVGYYENEGTPRPYYGYGGDMAEAAVKSESFNEVVLPTGENTVTSQVTITYQVR